MCGIAGIISNTVISEASQKVEKMTQSIAHRGPDAEKHWVNEAQSVALGHRRLSIIDLSSESIQPMHYLSRYSIVFNGEIYNYQELKQELIRKGYQFRTASDTEVLLALYDDRKEKCLQAIDGMFAFCIWDEKEKVAFCARDRFGEKPFFYHISENAFYFASEMKALWSVGVPKIPNSERVFLYLAYNSFEHPEQPSSTFYNAVYQLEPAHFCVIKNGEIVDKQKYWDIDLQHKIQISDQDAVAEFYRLFEQSIKRRMQTDVPLGSSLSGGLDSSSIVALVNGLKDKSVKQATFSARFPNYKKDEGEFIRQMVKRYMLDDYHTFLNQEVLNEALDEVFYFQEEPFGSTSVVAQYYVMKLAKENNVTVLLDGQGADEVLAGYFKYMGVYFEQLYRTNKKSDLKNAQQAFFALHGTLYPMQKMWKLFAKFPHLRSQLRTCKNHIIHPAYWQQFQAPFFKENKDLAFPFSPCLTLSESLYQSLFNGDLRTLLRYADRNSMAHSREVRLPFLNHELVSFVFSLPDDMKLRNGWTKYLLRNTMSDKLPEEICWRKEKVGFEPPNYLFVDAAKTKKAIEVLADNGILEKGKIIAYFHWNYFQVAKLFTS